MNRVCVTYNTSMNTKHKLRKRERRDGQAGKLHAGADSTWQSTGRLDQLSSPVLVPWRCLCNFVYDPFSSFFMMLILFTCDLIHFSPGVSRIQLHAAQPRLSPASTQHWTRVASGDGPKPWSLKVNQLEFFKMVSKCAALVYAIRNHRLATS